MLQECYNRVKRWLKVLGSRAPKYRPPGNVWLVGWPGRSTPKIVVFTLSLSFLSPLMLAQSQWQHIGNQTLTDYQLEFAASAEGRSRLGAAILPLDESYPTASEVWRALLQDGVLTHLNLPFQWRLVLVDDGSANAFSLPDGEVVVDRRLASLLGRSRGLWAALLSHEIAHIAHRHWLQRYSHESRLKQQPPGYGMALNAMDSRWRMAAFDQQMEVPGSLSNFSHELEFEADNEGMMLMARTGFHPDFELALHHLMEANFAEASKPTSYSTHPGWTSRDRNGQRSYRKAVEEFDQHWAAADSSPGGEPPTVVFLGEPKSRRQEPSKVSFSLRCANPGQELKSVLTLYERTEKKGKPREAIEFWQPATCNPRDDKKVISLNLPDDHCGDTEWKGEIRILNSDGVVLGRSEFFSVHVEKVNKEKSSFDALAYRHPATRD